MPLPPPPVDALLLFDGACGLCDRAVRLLSRIDRRRALAFAPLDGPSAAPYRHLAGEAGRDPEWLVLVERDGAGARVHVRSAAVARALSLAGGPWRAAATALAAIPRPIADRAYLAIARRRARLAPPSCPVHPAGDARFLP